MIADVFKVLNELKRERIIEDYAICGGQAKNYYRQILAITPDFSRGDTADVKP